MKKLLLFLFLFTFGTIHLQAQITTVGATQASKNDGSAQWSVTFNPKAGDTFLVGCDFNAGLSFIGVSDSRGDSFMQIGAEADSAFAARMYVATNIKGGSTTVTCNAAAAAASTEIYVTELKGVNASLPIDTFASVSGTSSTASGTITTSHANEVLWAYIVTGHATNANGWTSLSSFDGNLVSDRMQTTAGTVNASFPVSMGWTLLIAALNPASGASSISVTVSPTAQSVSTTQATSFTATVQNDLQNKGVTWSISGAGCRGGACGTLSQVSTSSVTYTAPANVPNPANVTLTATSIADPSKSASAAITVTAPQAPISISINPSTGTVQTAQSAAFTATVQNDSQNKGVTWAISGGGCRGAACGTLSQVSTSSVTYTAPANVPNPANVTLTATSIADPSKSASAAITVTAPPAHISVSVNPATAAVQPSQSAAFTASVQNDSQNKGVSWFLSGSSCSGSACGTLANVTTSSVTYTAPSTVTNSFSVALTATSITDSTRSASASITVNTTPGPTAPSNLSAAASSSSEIELTWGASSDPIGVSAYLVERCQGVNCSNFAQVGSSVGISFNDTGLAASTSYSYRVRATDSNNNFSAYSNTASATTDGGSSNGSVPTLVWSKNSAGSTGNPMHSYTTNLPTNGTLSGDVLITTFQYGVGSGASATVTDDKGDTLTLLESNSNSNQTVSTYCIVPTAGARVLTITFNGGMPAYVSMINASEWYNLTCALDGTSANSDSTSTITSGSISTTTDGDLIYQAVEEDGSVNTEQWVQGVSPWTFLSATSGLGATNPQSAQFQVQTTHSPINPTMTMNEATSWNSVAVALKAASSGTPPAAGIRIVHMQEEAVPPGPGGPFQLQFPSSGNLIITASNDGPTFDITGITDSNSNTHTQIGAPLFNDNSGDVQVFYAAHANTSNNLTLTYTMTGSPTGGSTFFLYDVADAATAPYDSTAGRQSAMGRQTSSGNVDGPTISPSTANGLVITQIAVDSNSIVNVTPGYFFGTIPNPLGQTDPTNENNGWGFEYNTSTTSRQYIWTTQGGPVENWISSAVAFIAAP